MGLTNVTIRFQNNVLHHGEANGKLMIVRRSGFDAVSGLREDLVTREDGDFFARLSRVGETRYEPALVVFNTWRRAHQLGWIRLQWIWMTNTIAFAVTGKPLAKEWKPLR